MDLKQKLNVSKLEIQRMCYLKNSTAYGQKYRYN